MGSALNTLQKHQPQLKNELRQQLAKDLGLAITELPELNLMAWLSEHLRKHHTKIGAWLYKIDVNPIEANGASFEYLAQKILEREAQKVIFRAQYSGRI